MTRSIIFAHVAKLTLMSSIYYVTSFSKVYRVVDKIHSSQQTMMCKKSDISDISVFPRSFDASSSKLEYLFLVPVIWGSYSPVIKGLYDSNANIVAPPGALFNFFSYAVAFLSLLGVAQFQRRHELGSSKKEKFTQTEVHSGIELGLWLFLGSSMQIVGIQGTSATKAAILVQSTTILVPILDSILNKRDLKPSILLACLIAGGGFFEITVQNSNSIGGLLRSSSGDFFILIAALFYSIHVVRLGAVAKYVSPIALSRVKSTTQLIISFFVASVSACFLDPSSFHDYLHALAVQPSSTGQEFVIAAILWNGIVATGIVTWAQTCGQQAVAPTTANLIYSMQPIFAALFSFSFLGESIEKSTLVGGALILLAVCIAVRASMTNTAVVVDSI